jgi:hypothetical protein
MSSTFSDGGTESLDIIAMTLGDISQLVIVEVKKGLDSDAGKNKGACFHALFMRDRPDLCTHMSRVKVTPRTRAGRAQNQTLLLDDHAPPSPRKARRRESLEGDVPDNFLRMFNSTEVDPLECPSVAIFDDKEEDVQLGRRSSATACTHALQRERH